MEEEHHNRPVVELVHIRTEPRLEDATGIPATDHKEVVDTAVVAERGSGDLLAQGLVQQQMVEQVRDQRLR